MKKNYTITLEEGTWRRLAEMAQEQDATYRGRLSRSAVIEQLVRGVPVAVQPAPVELAAAQLGPAQPAPVDAPAASSVQPSYRLADIVARWPEKTQDRWREDSWKAKTWVQLVLDTING